MELLYFYNKQFKSEENFKKSIKEAVLSVNSDWEKAFSLIPLNENIDLSADVFMNWFEHAYWPWQDSCYEYLLDHPERNYNKRDNAFVIMNRIKESFENGYQDCLYSNNERYSIIDECVDFFVEFLFDLKTQNYYL